MRLPSREDILRMHQVGRFSWLEYVVLILVMSVFAALPTLMFGGFRMLADIGLYILWYLLYWAAVAFIFCGLTAWQKYQAFDRPMRLLGEAARKVASGDFQVYIKPLNPPKRLTYVDYMFRDFNTMVKELGSLETMKSDFIANVSHEFKTPLAVIQNYAMDLKYKDLPPETQQEYLDTILSSAENLTTLVTNILRLNKVENQAIPMERKRYDLCRQLADCVIAFEAKWEERGLEVEAELEDSCVICEDENLYAVVWNNLLSNAIKFTEPGGGIFLRQFSDHDTVTVSVSDTGCGMRPETVAHIFDKFYQGDTSHSKEGNGLGLALVRRVVELSGGSISVDSAPGRGSTFTVVLPKHLEEL